MQQITPSQLADWLADASREPPSLLDVRELWEFEICHLEGAQLVPMHEIPARLQELPEEEKNVVVICHHGMRSLQVAMFLERSGFESVYNLTGGVEGWACEVDPAMPRY